MKNVNLKWKNDRDFFSKLGFSQYDNLIFEDENKKENFKKSMSIYSEYMKSID